VEPDIAQVYCAVSRKENRWRDVFYVSTADKNMVERLQTMGMISILCRHSGGVATDGVHFALDVDGVEQKAQWQVRWFVLEGRPADDCYSGG
jgi:hypothetical protein